MNIQKWVKYTKVHKNGYLFKSGTLFALVQFYIITPTPFHLRVMAFQAIVTYTKFICSSKFIRAVYSFQVSFYSKLVLISVLPVAWITRSAKDPARE